MFFLICVDCSTNDSASRNHVFSVLDRETIIIPQNPGNTGAGNLEVTLQRPKQLFPSLLHVNNTKTKSHSRINKCFRAENLQPVGKRKPISDTFQNEQEKSFDLPPRSSQNARRATTSPKSDEKKKDKNSEVKTQ
ncbi:unnamed protein product [Larinioides sclopetarius]|uniref:Uncharacterized protein n=1 Tax=Larinioides sclopetarius TaxID=280406 RepID=A0AAV2A533_9ARAC